MEFEEMKKIWDAQNKETLYAINENALYNRILTKKRTTNSITNISELLLIAVNGGASFFIVAISSFQKAGLFMYALAFWMITTAIYVLISRIRRLRGEHRFDKTMLGDLNQAISTASYQVQLSQLMRWNFIPIGTLSFVGVWSAGKPVWAFALIGGSFVLAYYASGWEHGIYKSKKHELEMLKKKLNSEEYLL